MRRAFVMLLLMSPLAGCAGQQAINQINADCKQADGRISSQCASKHPAFNNLPKNAQQQVVHRNLLEEQIAANKITPAQADFIQQEYEAKLLNQQNAANAVASQSAGNAMAATGMTLMAAGQRMTPQQRAAVLSGMPVMPPTYAAPVAAPPMMRTTNCNALGSTLNCTSF